MKDFIFQGLKEMKEEEEGWIRREEMTLERVSLI